MSFSVRFMVLLGVCLLPLQAHAQPAEAAQPVETAKPVEAPQPIEAAPPVETAKPIEAPQPIEAARPVEAAKPIEPARPVEGEKPATEKIDWSDGPFGRSTSRVELLAYAGTGTSSDPDKGGFLAGGGLEVCLLCIYTNDFRLAVGDYQVLRLGIDGVELNEGAQAAFGVTRDIDVGARVYYQRYSQFDASRQGVAFAGVVRWTRFTGALSFGPGNGSYFGASLRMRLSDLFGATVFYDRAHDEGAVPIKGGALRLAAVMTF
jgi:hypothetical protein